MAIVVFRADGSPSIGSGHIMRMLALAGVLENSGWKIGFAASEETLDSIPLLTERISDCLALPAAANEAEAMKLRWPGGADVLIVDHYGRDAEFEQACRPWARKIVVIDDLADRKHDADILVDSSTGDVRSYAGLVPSHCKMLVGPRYAMINPGFLHAREAALQRRGGNNVARILVTMGQMDPDNATGLALDAIEASGFLGEVVVVLGQAARHLSEVRRRATGRTRLRVNVSDMPALITNCDLAVGAGGVTAWERACLGLPSILIEIADNQKGLIATLVQSGAAVFAGRLNEIDKDAVAATIAGLLDAVDRRKEMSSAGARLVDGRCAQRILFALAGQGESKAGAVSLRPAEPSDEGWLLDLQRKPETRQHFVNRSVPTAEEHARWLAAVLQNPNVLLSIIEVGGVAGGYVRFDRRESTDAIPLYAVSIAVDPRLHGKGTGLAGLRLARGAFPGADFEAQVLPENAASLRLFERAGYVYASEQVLKSYSPWRNLPVI